MKIYRLGASTTMATLGMAAIVIALTISGCSNTTTMKELTFTATFTERTVIDGGAEGDSPGDYIPGNGDLFNSEGTVIGQFHVITFATGTTAAGQGRVMVTEYDFVGGVDSLVMAGAGRSPAGDQPLEDRTYTYPIVGGTGNYAGARGECSITRDGEAYDVNCRFDVLPS